MTHNDTHDPVEQAIGQLSATDRTPEELSNTDAGAGEMIHIAMHAHSCWSYDAEWELEDISRLFGSLGVRAVLMSEHDTGFEPKWYDGYVAACRAASTPRCTLVPGIEYSCPHNAIHILTWGLDRFLGAARPVMATLEDVSASDGVAVLAHPARRSVWQRYEPAWSEHLSGIEIWNRKSNGIRPCRKALALADETGLARTVGCDFHRIRNLYPLTQRVRIDGTGPIGDEIVARLRAGQTEPCAFARPLLQANGEPAGRWGGMLTAAAR